jgi:MYXO-CTERM domain-containing protein
MRFVRSAGALAVGLVTGITGTARAQSHVTCVGDSITFGDGTSGGGNTYPAVLQGLLGAGYSVENDGHSGATMTKAGDLPYWSTAEYGTSTTWAGGGGDVVIQLGTNDSKPKNWANKASFLGDCEAMIDHYRAASASTRVWINLIPPASSGACCKISGTTIENEVLPLLVQCAADKSASTIDVHAALVPHTSWFADGVHPNDQGAALIAQTVYDALAQVPTITLSASPPASPAPASVTLTAVPTAAYGKVEKVRFYEGAAFLQELTAAPWAITASNLAAGSHAFTAEITETAGRTKTSAPVTVDVDPAPPPPPPPPTDASADASDASSGGSTDGSADAAGTSASSASSASGSTPSSSGSTSGTSGASSSGTTSATASASPSGDAAAPGDEGGGCSSSSGSRDSSPIFIGALALVLGFIVRARRRL